MKNIIHLNISTDILRHICLLVNVDKALNYLSKKHCALCIGSITSYQITITDLGYLSSIALCPILVTFP